MLMVIDDGEKLLRDTCQNDERSVLRLGGIAGVA